VFRHDNTLDAVAYLPGIRTRAPDDLLCGCLDIGVIPDDGRVVPAEF
jgi:hypothetical protein